MVGNIIGKSAGGIEIPVSYQSYVDASFKRDTSPYVIENCPAFTFFYGGNDSLIFDSDCINVGQSINTLYKIGMNTKNHDVNLRTGYTSTVKFSRSLPNYEGASKLNIKMPIGYSRNNIGSIPKLSDRYIYDVPALAILNLNRTIRIVSSLDNILEVKLNTYGIGNESLKIYITLKSFDAIRLANNASSENTKCLIYTPTYS